MPYGLSDTTLLSIINVFKDLSKIKSLIIFGSRAMGRQKEGSDIDLAIKGDKITWNDLLELRLRLDDLMLPYTFDLVHLTDDLSPSLRDHIQRVGVVLFER